MIEIAMIEDLQDDRDRFSRCLNETMGECHIQMFETLQAFLEDNRHYDFILADVYLGDKLIFDYKDILSAKADYLMFTSVLSQNACRAYMPKSVGFIPKLKDDDKVKEILSAGYTEYLAAQVDIYTKAGAFHVNAKKVMYLLKEGKNVMAYFEGGKQIDMGRMPLASVASILKDSCIMANRSIYVNPAYIVRINAKEVRMADGQWTKPSKECFPRLQEQFIKELLK